MLSDMFISLRFQVFEERFKGQPVKEFPVGSKVEVFAEQRVWVGKVTGRVVDTSNEVFYRVHFEGLKSEDDLRVSREG